MQFVIDDEFVAAVSESWGWGWEVNICTLVGGRSDSVIQCLLSLSWAWVSVVIIGQPRGGPSCSPTCWRCSVPSAQTAGIAELSRRSVNGRCEAWHATYKPASKFLFHKLVYIIFPPLTHDEHIPRWIDLNGTDA